MLQIYSRGQRPQKPTVTPVIIKTEATGLQERCRSAPAQYRPSSPFHRKCVETICSLHTRDQGRQPYIRDDQEATEFIRSKIRRHKEVLVAVLDCSSIVPELFQRNLLSQDEVMKILTNDTKQNQNRRLLNVLAYKTPKLAYQIIEVIRSRQMIFKDSLEVPGLISYVARCDTKQCGRDVQRALKHLQSDPSTATKRCPICKFEKKKKRSYSAKITSQVGNDFSYITLPTNKIRRPDPIPLTKKQKRRLLVNLERISEISTIFEEDEDQVWIRVLKAEPDIIQHIYRDT